jgi:hypothetical protein
MPHPPQFRASTVMSVQALPHNVWLAGQAQAPLTQICPRKQPSPHVPQLDVSVARSAQELPQRVRGPEHSSTHAPAWHDCPAEHRN